MTDGRFYKGLGLTTLVAVGGAAGLHALMDLDYALGLTVTAIVVLALACVGMFYAGRWAAGHRNKFMFNNVFLGLTMVKMFGAGIAVVVFALVAEPVNKLFVLPFFLVYLIFSVYEVYTLVVVARRTPGVAAEGDETESSPDTSV